MAYLDGFVIPVPKANLDPRVAHYMDLANMPFDAKRMIYGGFEMIIDL